MKAMKVFLAIINVFILTFYIISFLIPRPTKNVGLAPGFLVSCAMALSAIHLLLGGNSDKTLAVWLIGILSIFFGFAIVCVAFAPDKNGKFWVNEQGKLITRSLNG